MDNLFNPDDFAEVLNEFNNSNEALTESLLEAGMTEEMKASQKRYEEYIKKHKNN